MVILLQVLPAALLGYVIPHSGTVATPNGLGTPLRYPQQFASALGGCLYPYPQQWSGFGQRWGCAYFLDVALATSKTDCRWAQCFVAPNTVPAASAFVSADVPAWQIVTQLGGQPCFVRTPSWGTTLPHLAACAIRPAQPLGQIGDRWIVAHCKTGQPYVLGVGNHCPAVGVCKRSGKSSNSRFAGQWQQFNHLYVANNVTPKAKWTLPFRRRLGAPGDWLLTWADFVGLTAAPSRFEIGMYTLPTVMRSISPARRPVFP